ncbi:MAG: hypothetical protein AAF281_10695, partial [Pseudomonadota bacterium]
DRQALAAAVETLRPHLIPDAAATRLGAVADAFPAGGLADILEIRPGGTADLSRAWMAPGGTRALAAAAPTLYPPLAPLLIHAAERPKTVPVVWLERDLAPGAPALPSVFVALPRPRLRGAALVAHVDEIARRLPVAPGAGETAKAVLGALPDTLTLSQIGAMVSRQAAPLRLVIDGVALAGLAATLSGLGWRGPAATVHALLAADGFAGHALRLHLDAGRGLQPRLGLELPTLDLGPDAVCAALAGLCPPAVADAVAAIATPMRLPGGAPGVSVQRRLNHVKIGLDAVGRIEVKVYVSVLKIPAFLPSRPAHV